MGRMRILISAMILAAAAAAQHQPPSPGGPPALLAGMGVHHHAIATRSAEAQKFFDQGLVLAFGFNREEALRSFRRASELDPRAAMPYWGMSLAQGPHINMDLDGDVNEKAACEAIAEARRRIAGAPESERLYVAAMAARCAGVKFAPGGEAAHAKAMRDLAARLPDDPDAATLLAESLMIQRRWRWWTPDGKPAEGVEEAVRTLESVIRRHPDHPGAHHFYIHAVEMSPTPERAVPSAQKLMGVVPGAGHLIHMAGHIWMLVGDYEMVADSNERAVQVDREYIRRVGANHGAYQMGYYSHNLHFVAVARAWQGRYEEARRAAEELLTHVAPAVEAMPPMAEYFGPNLLFVQLRFQRWDEILAAPRPDARLPIFNALWHYSRTLAMKGKGRLQEARSEQARFEDARKKVPADAIWTVNPARALLDLAAAVLEARLSPGREAAIAHWKRAAQLEDALLYDEPPAWYYPVRESLGASLLAAGRPAEAEAAFRATLKKHPRNGRALFGLMESLQAQKKTEAAAWVRREFEAAWRKAQVAVRVEDL